MATKRELQEENERLRAQLEEAYDLIHGASTVIGDALGFEDEEDSDDDGEETDSESDEASDDEESEEDEREDDDSDESDESEDT
ncbi:MAG TPA: hypothetical protein VNK46_06895 [Nitrospiraceae bacterium]|nr:hypothetical protein [Nitrospiraceae bacterium]